MFRYPRYSCHVDPKDRTNFAPPDSRSARLEDKKVFDMRAQIFQCRKDLFAICLWFSHRPSFQKSAIRLWQVLKNVVDAAHATTDDFPNIVLCHFRQA